MKHKSTRAAVGFCGAAVLLAVLIFSAMRVGGAELVGVFMMLPAVILASLIVTSNSHTSSL